MTDDGLPDAERKLWIAVIAAAWTDFFESKSAVSATDRDEAGKFLFNERGAWATSRALICDAAGICADRLRLLAIRERDGEQRKAAA
jgi:hypothetical protein